MFHRPPRRPVPWQCASTSVRSPDLMAWTDLKAESGLVAALDHAGERPPQSGSQNAKRDWSARFADACAVAIAAQFRTHKELRKKTVKPVSIEAGTEPLTPLGAGVQKRIDVTVADQVL